MATKRSRNTKRISRKRESRVIEIDCARIRPFKDQPRKHFDQDKLDALEESIKEIGQLQPALVRIVEGSTKCDYELIDGERRWCVCEQNGRKLRVIVEEVDDKHAQFEKSMASNYNREEPPPIDTARGLQRLMQSPRYRHLPVTERRERIGKVCGRSGTWVSQMLILLKLPEPVQAMLNPNDPQALPVSVGTYLASNFTSPKLQLQVAARAREQNLSAAETRRVAKRMAKASGDTSALRQNRPSDDWRFLDRFVRSLFDGCESISDMNPKAVTSMLATRTDAELTEMQAMLEMGAARVAELRDKVTKALGKGKGKRSNASNGHERARA